MMEGHRTREQLNKKIAASREENAAYMNQVLPLKDSFDMIQRDIVI